MLLLAQRSSQRHLYRRLMSNTGCLERCSVTLVKRSALRFNLELWSQQSLLLEPDRVSRRGQRQSSGVNKRHEVPLGPREEDRSLDRGGCRQNEVLCSGAGEAEVD